MSQVAANEQQFRLKCSRQQFHCPSVEAQDKEVAKMHWTLQAFLSQNKNALCQAFRGDLNVLPLNFAASIAAAKRKTEAIVGVKFRPSRCFLKGSLVS